MRGMRSQWAPAMPMSRPTRWCSAWQRTASVVPPRPPWVLRRGGRRRRSGPALQRRPDTRGCRTTRSGTVHSAAACRRSRRRRGTQPRPLPGQRPRAPTTGLDTYCEFLAVASSINHKKKKYRRLKKNTKKKIKKNKKNTGVAGDEQLLRVLYCSSADSLLGTNPTSEV